MQMGLTNSLCLSVIWPLGCHKILNVMLLTLYLSLCIPGREHKAVLLSTCIADIAIGVVHHFKL